MPENLTRGLSLVVVKFFFFFLNRPLCNNFYFIIVLSDRMLTEIWRRFQTRITDETMAGFSYSVRSPLRVFLFQFPDYRGEHTRYFFFFSFSLLIRVTVHWTFVYRSTRGDIIIIIIILPQCKKVRYDIIIILGTSLPRR